MTQIDPKIKLLEFPELRQTYNYDCGAAALSSVLAYYGIDVREDYLMHIAKTVEDGTTTNGMVAALQYYGLETVAGVMSIDDLKQAIDSGWPIIIALQAYRDKPILYPDDWDDGHYVVVIGYNGRRIFCEDPSSFKRTWLSFAELMDRWHDVDGETKIIQWGCVVRGIADYHYNDCIHMD